MTENEEYEFKVNETLRLTLSKPALEHVIKGDLGERLKMKDGKRTGETEKILKGGMHTVDGFLKFKSYHDNIEHLMFFNSNKDDYWYYARELQNGVINLRLPKDIFQSRAAKLTNFPDENYKSGYLWKTLFPIGWGEKEIINATKDALSNVDREKSNDGEVIGYALKEDPLKQMRICVLHRDGKINSIFPSWTQPCTGNNGKPYSHFDSIGHVLSESTLYFDSEEKLSCPPESSLLGDNNSLNNLPFFTPNFILKRHFVGESDIDIWTNEKNYNLLKYAGESSEGDIENIKRYLLDGVVVKDNYMAPRYVYDNHFFEVIFSKEFFNSFHIPQNIIDSMSVVSYYDAFNKTNHIDDIINFLLANMVTHTGCLDSWNKKRVLNTMIDIVLSHHDKSLVSRFIKWLAESPCRRELYIDINCATFEKIDLDIDDVIMEDGMFDFSLVNIHSTEQPIKCKLNHFKYYYMLSLGETYLAMFNLEMLESFFDEHHSFNLKCFVSDSIKYTRSRDLMLFSEQFDKIVDHVIKHNITDLDETTLLCIFKDYYRIQSAQRLRSNLYYKDVSNLEIDYGNPKSIEFIRATCLKHERACNQFSINMFFDSCERLSSFMNFNKFQQEIAKQRESYFKEVPPLPDRNHLKLK
ncbi:hypothetical protein [Vibrio parahaemolyticus]|uniref:hypothetical protein n=1 Tax=Vibrio parahaemolyticus TaxID=670 RepID=UPI00389191C3